MAGRAIAIEASSGNVFTDLGLPDGGELDAKARLAVKINSLMAAQRLNQARAAALLKVGQPTIYALKNYCLDGFSVERLVSVLRALGQCR